MAASSRSSTRPPRRRPLSVWLLATALVLGLLWFTFFDSYSLVKRVRWSQEYSRLSQQNERLRHEMQTLEARLDKPLPDAVIEKIAREQYGMRRPGETIYRVEE